LSEDSGIELFYFQSFIAGSCHWCVQ